MLALFSFSFIFISIFYLAFAIVIIFRGWRNTDNRLMAAFGLTVSFWAFSCWRFHAIPAGGSETEALLWARFLIASSLFIPPLIIHWAVSFLRLQAEKKHALYITYFSYIFVSILAALTLSPFHGLVVTGIEQKMFFPFWPNRGPLYTLYIIYMYGGLSGYATYLLFLKYRKVANNKKESKKFFLVFSGVLVSYIGGATNFFLWFDVPVPPVGNFFIPSMVFFFGYAVVRHHLFDIKAIATEFITILIWIFLFFRVLIAPTTGAAIIDSIFFVLTVVFGTFLMRSVNHEVTQRAELARLNTELNDLNEHLEDKVREQTKDVRQAYEIEKKARHELEELDRAKTEFILTTQHHLRTPLTIVHGALGTLLARREKDTVHAMDIAFAKKAYTATNTLKGLVREFIYISQIETGKMDLQKENISPHRLIEDVLKNVSERAQNKGLSLSFTPADEARIAVPLDPEKMRDAFSRILDNAIRYTHAGSVTVTEKVIKDPLRGTLYRLTVEDQGIGMTPEELKNAFTRSFERGALARELYATGRGIGLMIAQEVITAHGGTVRASSPGRDKGSRFVIELPVESAPSFKADA